jgi:hypothetical protein
MTVGKDLHEYTQKEVMDWAKKKDLEPGLVRETKDSIRMVTKGGTDRVEPISWDKFFQLMKHKNLTVYGTDEGWMKIMKKK